MYDVDVDRNIYTVVTSKYSEGFVLFHPGADHFNVVDGTPLKKISFGDTRRL